MAKTDTTKTAAAGAEASEYPVTLDEFCARFSATDKRVELIAAFHQDEESAGRRVDLEGNYSNRLAAFAARPV